MLRTPTKIWTILLLAFLLTGIVTAQDYEEDETDEPGARVARVSFLKRDAKIKRFDTEEWEDIVDNLPLVEGDTIETGDDSRMEIQLDRYSFLRLNENSVLKFTFLADEGVALSLSKGSLGVTLIRFDTSKSYLEVDAPQSTVAIKKTGTYRIDAGDEYNKEVRVSVRDEGEARVYSTDSGFFLKDERTARLFLDGNFAGEWETSRNSSIIDEFDDWTRDRDRNIAASFADDDDDDQYVDSDIYGADDLDRYGDWVYLSDYGNVWQPSSRAISTYLNWTPYRYGSWRWLPYYGWTWVNDEPWGWATYHYGRWIHHRGRWYWSPYGHNRRGRSLWRPALVFVTYIGNNFCWYPLPYGYGYYNYNHRFRNRWNRRHHRGNDRRDGNPPRKDRKPPVNVPPSSVVAVNGGQFGSRGKFGVAPLGVARQVLRQRPVINDSPPVVPDRKLDPNSLPDVTRKRSNDTKTGATRRTLGESLDKKLRQEKVYGNRTPRTDTPASDRKQPTGAFDRKRERKSDTAGSGPVLTPPIRPSTPSGSSGRNQKSTDRKQSTPLGTPQTRRTPAPSKSRPTRKQSPPVKRSSPPVQRKQSPPLRRSSPPTRKPSPPSRPPSRPAPKPAAPKRSAPKPEKKAPSPPNKGKPKPIS